MALDSPPRPVLDLSGERLTAALESVIRGAEPQGGVERWVTAIHLKASLFQEIVGGERFHALTSGDLKALCAFIAPVRRRVGPWLTAERFPAMREAIVALLSRAGDTSGADANMAAFRAAFPDDRAHRWVRDLAAELLHYTRPEQYPLMTRWMWDAKANTGVLREIWFHPEVDRLRIPVDDGYETFLVLREELAGFLAGNGIFRDMPFYIDLLCAAIYGDYIAAQGGSYLRTDFGSPDDPMAYARRMLGLDGLDTETGRTRLKLIDGEAFVLPETQLLN